MNKKKYLGYKNQYELNKMEETLEEFVEERKKVWLIDAVAYIRYSSHMQDNGVSVEYQVQEVTEWAKRNNYRIVEWFIDKATSAKETVGRDEFLRMFRGFDNGTLPPNLIIWGTNRAFRDAMDSAIHREKLRKKGVKLFSATQNLDDDTTSGRLMIDLIARIDQYKVEEIGDHVAAAMKLLISEGFFAGGRVPYGYKIVPVMFNGSERKKLAIEEKEAEVVKYIFESFIAGRQIRRICKSLVEKGIYSRNGKAFEADAVRKIVRNQIYTGERTYSMSNGETIYCTNYCEPLITKTQFEVAKKLLQDNRDKAQGRNRKSIYPLTGHLICGHCGMKMSGFSGKKIPYYTCASRYKTIDRCGSKMIRKDWIAEVAFNVVKENLLSDDAIKTISAAIIEQIKKAPAVAEDKKELNARKKVLEAEIIELVNMKLKKEISEDIFKAMKQPKDNELISIERKLDTIAASLNSSIDEAYITKQIKSIFDSSKTFEECDPLALKDLFNQTIDYIEVSDTQVVIHLRLPLGDSLFNDGFGNAISGLNKQVKREFTKGGIQKKAEA